MRTVFMGSSDFSLPALKAIYESNHELLAVCTKPPSVAGRGMKLAKNEVYEFCEEHKILVLSPKNLRDEKTLFLLESFKLDVIAVCSYGLILPLNVLNMPKYGCINIHPSNLPMWRGADPIRRTIMSGDKKSAVCIMKMDEGLDTGDVFLKKELDLNDKDSYSLLLSNMAIIGADALIEAMEILSNGTAVYEKQSTEGVSYADKLSSEEEVINWNDYVVSIHNKIRALSPRPGAYFKYLGEQIKILESNYIETSHKHKFGTIIDENLSIACEGGILIPELLQRQGRKVIYRDAFLRGFNVERGIVIS
ncbi:Methionyl-tRNA formyltransferase [Candidatus Cyrtobacter comes]|uniref:Methionyl-tRNA formyltransferase n=1 Tax=Candidatus Cyrtobacter comes TaxID=675776 RepID=A0ABU5L7Z1_9RICK|nr:methionyl-tRNA formyltransferase [Candidatus Cyrtobacter comes]MDZ5762242.1 Methionyl-tRNA formyltransferase [Candidatus Cyrtobacter comes]